MLKTPANLGQLTDSENSKSEVTQGSLRNQRGSRDNCLLKKMKTRGDSGVTKRSRDNYTLKQKARGNSGVKISIKKAPQCTLKKYLVVHKCTLKYMELLRSTSKHLDIPIRTLKCLEVPRSPRDT